MTHLLSTRDHNPWSGNYGGRVGLPLLGPIVLWGSTGGPEGCREEVQDDDPGYDRGDLQRARSTDPDEGVGTTGERQADRTRPRSRTGRWRLFTTEKEGKRSERTCPTDTNPDPPRPPLLRDTAESRTGRSHRRKPRPSPYVGPYRLNRRCWTT